MQRADGAFGAFIVRVPEKMDPHCDLYDFDLNEHVMMLLDWGREHALEKFIAHHHSDGDNKPQTLLINGLGRNKLINKNNQTIYTPVARFLVEQVSYLTIFKKIVFIRNKFQGYRYRMRIINNEFLNCPIQVSVDNHTLTVISSDGNDFRPVKADSLVIYAGERFDFILNADQPKDLYWIRFRGLMDCDARFKSAHQVAVLQYLGMPDDEYPDDEPSYQAAYREGIVST